MKTNYYVIGDPVGHSLSPVIHNTLYGIYGLDCVYSARKVTRNDLPSFIDFAQNGPVGGFNVTMPLKKEIIQYLDLLYAPGSVNTVVKTPGAQLAGYSTDAQGFYAGLQSKGYAYTNQNVVFIGYGAVTQLLAQDAMDKGAARITVLNRTPDKAKAFAQHDRAVVDALDRISLYMEDCDILINTTPLGMAGTGNDFQDLSFIQMLRPSAIVCDLIYDPPTTALLAAAQKNGNAALNGLPMLIWQAFYAFEKFFGIMPTIQDYEVVHQKLMADK